MKWAGGYPWGGDEGGLGVPEGADSSSSSGSEVARPPDPELDDRRDDNVAEFYQGALDLVHHINALPDITCEVKSSLIILHVWRLIPQPI